MLLLPTTPPLTYPNMKRFKGPKMDSLHFTFHFTFTSHFHKVDSGDGSALYKAPFKGNAARARLARGFRNKKISREISCKKFKTHLQFYVKISNKNFSSFFTGKSLYNFSKKLLLRPFFKNSLQEGVFENSLNFLQLVPNLTPIRKLLCTFSIQCCYYPRPSL